MGNKTIYIQDDALWKGAKKLAGKAGLSSVIAKALEEFVHRSQRQMDGFIRKRYEFVITDDEGDRTVLDYIAFEGKLVFAGQLQFGSLYADSEEAAEAAVYVEVHRTPKENLVIVSRHPETDEGEIEHWNSYRTVKDLSTDSVVLGLTSHSRARLITELSRELKENFVTWIE